MTSSQGVTKDLIKKVLDEYYQAILSGPPGTSKSFTLEQLKKDYADTLHIQFHPQYSYQEFIGGYVVDGQNVEWQRGVFEKFVSEEAMKNPDKKYLVIIDEINRANTSQVFGETIQCLDRGSSVSLRIDKNLKEFSLPKNLYIVGTMNSTDKTIGSLDYALKRRFITIYCPPNPDLLIQLCPSTNGFISLYDFLTKINAKLKSTLKNNEDVIGHAIFLNDAQKDAKGQYVWNFDSFEILFNYKILPVIEDYCNGSQDQIINILGSDLPKRLSGSDFKKALLDFMNE